MGRVPHEIEDLLYGLEFDPGGEVPRLAPVVGVAALFARGKAPSQRISRVQQFADYAACERGQL